MNTRILLTAFLLGGVTLSPVALRAADPTKKPTTPDTAALPGPEAQLKLAMPAADVLRIMGGKPDRIKPLEVQKGRAEVWAYDRSVSETVEQIESTTPKMESIPGPNGVPILTQTGVNIEHRQVHHITTDVVELLMFNDHFVTRKITRHVENRIY